MLADILDLETGVIVNLHIRSIDQTEAIKTIKRKITDLDKMKIEEQKKAVRSGYDMDIIPSDLATFGSEAKNLLQDLQSRNERMFLLTFLVVNMADTKRKLENDIFAAAGIAQKYNCALTRLDYQQEAGLMSSIPLGENLIPIQRGLTTSSTAIFIPFITQELFQTGAALYYGLNALSNNMILCDRKQLKNPNGLILGTPGSGKSFAAKREMTNAFLITDDDIIICDPEAEYFSLVQRLTAFAQTPEQPAADATNDSGVIYEEPEETAPLTPEGNATLVDDFGGNKQLITVTTKAGNYFYILIDRDDEGENTVHFLNQVDDADLFALLEDGENSEAQTPAVCTCTEKCETGKINTSCPVCSTNMTACSGKEAEPEPEEPTEQSQEKSNTGGLVLFLVVALLGGGGAFYYFKFMKPKQSVKGGTDLEDFDFEDYDEDEPEPDDADGDASEDDTEDEDA